MSRSFAFSLIGAALLLCLAVTQSQSVDPGGLLPGSTQDLNGSWSILFPALPPVTLPIPRVHHTAIYDPTGDRMILWGGDPITHPEVWALPLSGDPQWAQLETSGAAPGQRWGHAAVYDPNRNRMIIFGGFDNNFLLNDVWALSLGGTPTWTQLVPGGTPPPRRRSLAAIFDPAGDRMIVYGGYDGSFLSDVW